MPILKNPRHEKFAREYVKTGVGAEAYRRVYPRASEPNIDGSRQKNKQNRIQSLRSRRLKRVL